MNHRTAAMVSGALVAAGGLGLIAVHYYGGTDGDQEGWFAAIGFGAPFVGVGLLAILGGARRRPELCVGAGMALWPMSIVSFVLLPLFIVATVLVSVGVLNGPSFRSIVVADLLGVVLIAAFGFLVLHQDPVTWSTPTGSGSSSNIVTSFEAMVSLLAVSAVLGAAVAWTERGAAT